MQETSQRTIWLIRHAQSTANRDRIIQGHLDTELTEVGLEQAHYTGLYFKEKQNQFAVEHLYSSDLLRTRQTASFIAEHLGLKIKLKPELREANFGKWEGYHSPTLSVDDPENYERWMSDKKWRPDWCESFADLQLRGYRAISQIVAETTCNVAIVTHGGIIHSFVLHLTKAFGESPSSHNCGITTLSAKGQDPQSIEVKSVNFVAPGVPVTTLELAPQDSDEQRRVEDADIVSSH
jgi:broad specificity phosphatase PhoE